MLTVTSDVPATVLSVADILVVPVPTAVANPAALTVAMDGALEDHVT